MLVLKCQAGDALEEPSTDTLEVSTGFHGRNVIVITAFEDEAEATIIIDVEQAAKLGAELTKWAKSCKPKSDKDKIQGSL